MKGEGEGIVRPGSQSVFDFSMSSRPPSRACSRPPGTDTQYLEEHPPSCSFLAAVQQGLKLEASNGNPLLLLVLTVLLVVAPPLIRNSACIPGLAGPEGSHRRPFPRSPSFASHQSNGGIGHLHQVERRRNAQNLMTNDGWLARARIL